MFNNLDFRLQIAIPFRHGAITDLFRAAESN